MTLAGAKQLSRKILNQKGLSVVELVVASGVLMAISFGVATFLPAGMKANDKTRKKMVSSNLFHEVMEEAQTLEYDHLHTGSEPRIPSGSNTVLVLDTSQNQVTLDHATGLVTGDVISFGTGTQAVQYPRHYRINNVDYRVDIKIIKFSKKNNAPHSTSHQGTIKKLPSHIGNQTYVKKVQVYVTPWQDESADLNGLVSDGSFLLKGTKSLAP